MHPVGNFADGESKPGLWREVSVGGGVFSTRESRSAQQKGQVVSIVRIYYIIILNLIGMIYSMGRKGKKRRAGGKFD